MENRVNAIRNKDIPVLRRVIPAMQEVCIGEQKIQWLHDRMYFITQRFSQTPGCGGQSMGFDATLADMDDMSDEHRRRIKDCLRELNRAERTLNDISDANMRTFVLMLYVMDLSPAQVRSELNMSDWKFRRSREIVERAVDMKRVKWYEVQQETDENNKKISS